MTRVLLTGGNGFVASHVLDTLLERSHTVVTTVRSQVKADQIKQAYANVPAENLGFAIVPDIVQPGAFDKAVVSDPPVEAVIHTATPFLATSSDPVGELFPAAINGTVGILEAVKKFAPTVKAVVVTSSLVAIVDETVPDGHVFNENDWNPITKEIAGSHPFVAHMASKTFAEKAAWEFMEKEKPSFTLSTILPPYVFGPPVPYLNTLPSTSSSNKTITDFYVGAHKDQCPASSPYFFFVDVRDAALAHVLAVEKHQRAAGRRILLSAGRFTSEEITQIIGQHFPDVRPQLPADLSPGKAPPPEYCAEIGGSFASDGLGLKFRPLSETVVDLIGSIKSLQA